MLGRRVRVTVVAPGHPAAPAVLDAARRAAGVDDARLVRILDVGSEHEPSLPGHRVARGHRPGRACWPPGRWPPTTPEP
nr:hypothetical protein [Angustibacter aerolatus]